ncbi:TPA: hypothetical protein N0F65_012803 [Lagenidium giganteum]|uniref:Transposase n=1 Tax=Lagenidium giganteum TaxID=4803 RepID=A0AAV2YGQ1_9STRA|nr:TPA: hypothetical protein N0F65_012803 [Lagenidium giganteum]
MDEWVHFEKLPEEGRVPNSSYWYVLCRHCVRAFEHKQLAVFPPKLTGRRSAMRAHLKICPVYGTQYKLEQTALAAAQAQVHAAAAAAASVSGAVMASAPTASSSSSLVTTPLSTPGKLTPTESQSSDGERRKRKIGDGSAEGTSGRGGRGKHCMMEEWDHFVRLQEFGYIGKSNFFQAVCKHCQQAYDEAPEEKKPSMVPERMVGRREKMRKHLSLCPYFKGELPPLDRRGPPRVIPMISSVRTTVGGALMLGGSGNSTPLAATPSGGSNSTNSNGAAATTTTEAAFETGATESARSTSRLALDEWQFFTRLHRKKDSAYYFARCNFCQEAFENAPEALKSSMEPTVVMGRKSNMQTHLAKCPHVPRESATYNKNLVFSVLNTFGEEQPSAKRMKLTSGMTGLVGDSYGLDGTLLEFTIQHKLPFEWLDSSSTTKLLRLLQQHQVVFPRSEDLRGPILDSIFDNVVSNEVTKLKEKISLLTPDESSVTATDPAPPQASWPVVVHVIAHKSKEEDAAALPRLSCAIDTENLAVGLPHLLNTFGGESHCLGDDKHAISHFHGLEVARWIEHQLHQVVSTAKLAPRILITPAQPTFQRATSILRARWPKMIFVPEMEPLVRRCLRRFLQLDETKAVVALIVDIWQLKSVQDRFKPLNPMHSRFECQQLLHRLLEERQWSEASIEANESLEKLNTLAVVHVAALWQAMEEALTMCSSDSKLRLADVLMHFEAIFVAAEGFETVRDELESIWAQLEQPIFILAHALHPHLRLKNMVATELTKPSTVSDLAVLYFAELFGRKAVSLRGDATAYLHESQPPFDRNVLSEFAMVDDYFRYLSDNYSELSALMSFLASVPAKISEKFKRSVPLPADETKSERGYSAAEARKLDILRDFWHISVRDSHEDQHPQERSEELSNVMEPMGLSDQWIADIEAKLRVAGMELEEPANMACVASQSINEQPDDQQTAESMDGDSTEEELVVGDGAGEELPLPLPKQDHDDVMAFATHELRGDRGKKVLLRELFPPVQATI